MASNRKLRKDCITHKSMTIAEIKQLYGSKQIANDEYNDSKYWRRRERKSKKRQRKMQIAVWRKSEYEAAKEGYSTFREVNLVHKEPNLNKPNVINL